MYKQNTVMRKLTNPLKVVYGKLHLIHLTCLNFRGMGTTPISLFIYCWELVANPGIEDYTVTLIQILEELSS